MKTAFLIIALLVFSSLPFSTASHSTAPNEATDVDPLSFDDTCGSDVGGFQPLTPGNRFILVAGSQGATGGTSTFVGLNANASISGSTILFRVTKAGTLTSVNPAADLTAVLLRHVNVSSTQFHFAVEFTFPNGSATGVQTGPFDDITGTRGCAPTWDNAGHVSESEMAGYQVTMFSQDGQRQGFMFTTSVGSEAHSLTVEVRQCDQPTNSGICESGHDIGRAGSGFFVQLSGNVTDSETTGSNSLANFQRAEFFGNVGIRTTKTSYRSEDYTYTVPNGVSNRTYVWVYAAPIVCSPDPGNFTVPAVAIINVTRLPTVPQAFYTFFRLNAAGIPSVSSSTFQMLSFNATLRYPIGKNATTDSPGFNDTGAYLIAFSDAEVNLLEVCRFVIGSSTFFPSQAILDESINSTIRDQLLTVVSNLRNQEDATEQQQTLTTLVLDFARLGFDAPILIPNMYWLIIFMGIIAMFRLVMDRRQGT